MVNESKRVFFHFDNVMVGRYPISNRILFSVLTQFVAVWNDRVSADELMAILHKAFIGRGIEMEDRVITMEEFERLQYLIALFTSEMSYRKVRDKVPLFSADTIEEGRRVVNELFGKQAEETDARLEGWAIGRRLAFEGVQPTSAVKNVTGKTKGTGGKPVKLSQDEREALGMLYRGETTTNVDECMREKGAIREGSSGGRRSWQYGDAKLVRKAWKERGGKIADLS